MCTFETSGQVASMTGSPRSAARSSIALATPCALKIVTLPGGTSSISSTKLRPLGAQPLDDVAVVHDLVADIDRRAVFLERALDDLDRAFDPGAEASRLGQHHPHHIASPASQLALGPS